RIAAVELPVVAGSLQRTGVSALLLAGLQRRASGRSDARLRPPRTPLRRPCRARRRLVSAAMSNLQVRAVSAVVLAAAVLAVTWLGGLPFRLLSVLIA